jgi:sulfonate transport system permease protein
MYLPDIRNRFIGIIVPVLLLAAWYLVSVKELFSPQLLPPPGQVFDTLKDMIASGELVQNLRVSLLRVSAGFLLGATLGFLLGTIMGFYPVAEEYIAPLFNVVRQVPTIAWLPFLIVLFGIDELFKVTFIALGALIPMALKTWEGIKGVPATYVEVVRVFEFRPCRLLGKVIIPSALPSILVGLRLSLSEAWMLAIGAELVAASVGIGNVMTVARRLFQTDVVLVGVFVIAVTGFVMDSGLVFLEKRFLGWRGTASYH